MFSTNQFLNEYPFHAEFSKQIHPNDLLKRKKIINLLTFHFRWRQKALKISSRCYLNNYPSMSLQCIYYRWTSCISQHMDHRSVDSAQKTDFKTYIAWFDRYKRKSPIAERGLGCRNSNQPLAFLDNKDTKLSFWTLPSNYVIGTLCGRNHYFSTIMCTKEIGG